MENLKEYLIEFQKLTIALTEAIEGDTFDKIDALLTSRQAVMDSIDKLSYSKEEFTSTAKELDLQVLQKRLDTVFSTKRMYLLEGMKKISITRNVHNSYNNTPNHDSYFFNKKF